MAVQARTARADLLAARSHLEQARRLAVAGDLRAATDASRQAEHRTDRAVSATSGPVWRAAGALPLLGATPAAVRVAVGQADLVAGSVVPDLLLVAERLQPQRLRSRANGADVDVAGLTSAERVLTGARDDLRQARQELRSALDAPVLGPVSRPLDGFRAELDELGATVDDLSQVVGVLPGLLGADGERRYLLAFQNLAEARGTGGLVGAYGILEAQEGRLRVAGFGTDGDVAALPRLPKGLPPEFEQLYGPHPALWVNANMSPHFPYAAMIWLRAWQRTHGERLDGVVAVDPVALSYVLAGSGPFPVPGHQPLRASTVVDTTLREAYARFGSDSVERTNYLSRVFAGAVSSLLSGGEGGTLVSTTRLEGLRRAVVERRLLFYSARPAEQELVERTPLAGTLPTVSSPWAMVTVVNVRGNKLDYYLERDVAYLGAPCRIGQGLRPTTVRARLRTALEPDQDLPGYAVGKFGRRDERAGLLNRHRVLVGLYGTRHARVRTVAVQGEPVPFRSGTERGRPVALVAMTLDPGTPQEVTFGLVEPSAAGPPRLEEQPLVRPQRSTLDVPECQP